MEAISLKGMANRSCRTKASRSGGVSVSSTVRSASPIAIEGPETIGLQPAAQLLTFRDGLIAEVRAWFDPRPFSPPKKGN